MSDNDWWYIYGHFNPWHECPTRPDPGEVLAFYLEQRGIAIEEQVAYLMDLLNLKKSMVYNILKGDGLDSISRCRVLVKALKIPPTLLGLDAKYYPIERHAYWWRKFGFSSHADADGYPVVSEFVAYLRLNRTQKDEEGRVKVWSQEDLGDATDLKKETVYRMEHLNNPFVLESMHRRAIVASAIGTLAGDQEPTIFRLFGLDPRAYGVPVPAHESVPVVHFLPERLTDEMLYDYQQKLATFFTAYYTGHAQGVVEEACECVRQLVTLESLAKTCVQRVELLALRCRYHQVITGVAREQRKRETILHHGHLAVELAEQAMTLPNPKLGEHALIVITNELLAAALLWRADAYYELDEFILAQADIDRALNLLPALQSSQLKLHTVADAGLIHAHTGTSEMERALVLSFFNLAAQLNAPSQCRAASLSPDEHFIRGDAGLLYLRKAMALCAPKMKGTTSEKVLDLLETARRFTDPAMIRRQVIIEVFQAKAYFEALDYQQATEVALSALEKSRQIRSRLNRDRIEGLYLQLMDTFFRGKPLLAYLGMKLRMWSYGREPTLEESADASQLHRKWRANERLWVGGWCRKKLTR